METADIPTALAAGSGGLSRRQVIKAGAVAGGAVWVAPVIDSFVSRAAAVSKPSSPPNVPFGCSWLYLVYKDVGSDAVYYTGFGATSGTCNQDSADPTPHGTATVTCTDSAGSLNSYTLGNAAPGPPPLSYSGTDIGSGTLTSTTDGCSSFSYSGSDSTSEIHAGGGVELVAIFAFGAASITAACPNSAGGGNTVDVVCGGQPT